MKVVIDTNIFVGALQSYDGINRKILQCCFEGDIDPLMGDALYYEYESLLHRDYLFERSLFHAFEREDFLNDFLSLCQWVRVHYRWRPNLPDEGDNHIIELALAGGANKILTWNKKDFRGGDLTMRSLEILTPEDYLRKYSTGRV